MWWILGISGLFLGYKFITWRQRVIDVTLKTLKSKIQRHRELARKGNHESLKYLQSLDAALVRVERENSSAGRQMLDSLQYEGLYPPSAL